ncbi:YbbR domain-containing protein [Virgibacillus natechei]|uniref:YbbR domain-containing protein n=1 Tax=Virgibacillus natechei TaxID=1216297 RepID=A0ABS4IGB9_9BACI|nr:CdaR family protein [Virgibacillus natechei]MBP1969991.1 YbbR domain-containing protein [Virgibacillus natechei]UZD13351.1 CdaR family protein [Virgibacillus natechei]
MDKWFESKWFVRIISLGFAILLYVMVSIETNTAENDSSFFPAASEEIQTLEEVPVEIRIDQESYVVSGVPEYVTVSLEGVASVLTPIERQRNFDVFVDLEGLGEGEHEVEIEHENIPTDLSVLIEPKQAVVTIEERATQEFPVDVDFINTEMLADGFELGDYEVDPGEVSITSSRSVVDQIAVVKVFVNLSEVDQSINNREVPINVYDAQGNELNVRVEPENAVVSAEIDNPSRTVPVNILTTGELPNGYSLSSISPEMDELEIFGTTDVLDEIEEISSEEIDLSEITESGTVDVSLSLPDGVASETGEINVELEVEELEAEETEAEEAEIEGTRTMEDVPIEPEGLEDGQEITFIDPSSPEMDITIEGGEDVLSELTIENFSISIDVNDLEEGEHTLSVTIEGPDNVTITEEEFEEVTIEMT